MIVGRRWVLLLLLSSPGCYSYRATTLDALRPGDEVRVRISPDEAERLAEALVSDDRLVVADVLEQSASALLVETQAAPVVAPGARPLRQRISIPVQEIREVEMRELDRVKTGLVGGVIAAATAWLLIEQLQGGSGRPDTDPPDVPDMVSTRRTWLRFPLFSF